jgi:uncharacterized membrane protein
MAPLIFIHVLAGFSGLATGIVVMAMPNKGNKLHKKIGLVYFITMMVSTVLSIYLSILVNKMFLLYIGFFTLYMLLAGYISTPRRVKKFKWLFIPLSVMGLISGFYMISSGIIFLVVFGALQTWLVVQDLWMLRKKDIHPLDIAGSHAGKMAGSFIAASTAFAVNVIFTGGEWWHWLLPTFAITPLITIWNIQLKKRKQKLLDRTSV